MGTAKRELIMRNLVSALQGITKQNGFNNTIQAVYRFEQAGNSAKTQPFIEIMPISELIEQSPNPYATCTLTVDLDVWVRHIKSEFAESTDALLITLFADVTKAIMADQTFGGYAINTKIKGNYPFESVEGQAYSGITINIEITYRHLLNDPEN